MFGGPGRQGYEALPGSPRPELPQDSRDDCLQRQIDGCVPLLGCSPENSDAEASREPLLTSELSAVGQPEGSTRILDSVEPPLLSSLEEEEELVAENAEPEPSLPHARDGGVEQGAELATAVQEEPEEVSKAADGGGSVAASSHARSGQTADVASAQDLKAVQEEPEQARKAVDGGGSVEVSSHDGESENVEAAAAAAVHIESPDQDAAEALSQEADDKKLVQEEEATEVQTKHTESPMSVAEPSQQQGEAAEEEHEATEVQTKHTESPMSVAEPSQQQEEAAEEEHEARSSLGALPAQLGGDYTPQSFEAASEPTTSWMVEKIASDLSGRDLVRLLLEKSDKEIIEGIEVLVQRRPGTLDNLCSHLVQKQTVEEVHRRLHTDAKRRSETLSRLSSSGEANWDPMVQFATDLVVCQEEHQTVRVNVVRIGNLSKTSSVAFETKDGSAEAGLKYDSLEGRITFQPGEAWQSIDIHLLDNDIWDSNLQFYVDLKEENMQNAVLGRQLARCRVLILDDETFPTRTYENEVRVAIDSNSYRLNGSRTRLITEYLKMNIRHPVVRAGTIKWMLADQVINVINIFQVLMQLLLIDYVLNAENGLEFARGEYNLQLLLVLVISWLVPNSISHFLDHRRCFWKVSGASCLLLRSNLFRRYLGATATARHFAAPGRLIEAMTKQTDKVVGSIYIGALKIVANVSQLLMFLIYQSFVPHLTGQSGQSNLAVIVAMVYPIVMAVFFRRQLGWMEAALEKESSSRVDLLQELHEGVTNFDFITDLQLNEDFIQRFESKVSTLNKALVEVANDVNHLDYSLRWLSWVLVALYMALGGVQLISMEHPSEALPTFVTNLTVLTSTGTTWCQVWHIIVDQMAALPHLHNIVVFMNLNQTSSVMEDVQNYRVKTTRDLERSLGIQPSAVKNNFDKLPFLMPRNLRFLVADSSLLPDTHTGYLSVPQGGLYAFVGPSGGGKRRFLTRLGGVPPEHLRPSDEKPFVPSHLRIAHVVAQTFFVRGSLLENLTLGTLTPEDADPTRVRRICQRLGVRPRTLAALDTNEVLMDFSAFTSDMWLLQIARVLVMNPEVLCIHTPTMPMDDESALIIMNCLKEYVLERGLEVQDTPMSRRRLHTCFCTLSRRAGVVFADKVFEFEQGHLFEVEDVGALTEAMFRNRVPNAEESHTLLGVHT